MRGGVLELARHRASEGAELNTSVVYRSLARLPQLKKRIDNVPHLLRRAVNVLQIRGDGGRVVT